jgi:hypothetical protein
MQVPWPRGPAVPLSATLLHACWHGLALFALSSPHPTDPCVYAPVFAYTHTADNAAPATHSSSGSGSTTPPKAAAGQHHMTATAHSPRDTADAAPAAACDQAARHADGTAANAANMSSSAQNTKQVAVRPVHMPHGDLKHLMASAHARPYTGALL